MKYTRFLILLSMFHAVSINAEEATDAYYDKEEMEASRQLLKQHHGGSKTLFIIADRLEYKSNEGDALIVWDGQGWFGTDLNKFWVKTEGEYDTDNNIFEEAEIQALYSRAISSFWDVQAGIRYDIKPNPTRSFAVFGIQGLAPYWFEIDAAGFISDEGNFSARLEAEYELLITQRLILQPRLEFNLATQDDTEIRVGSGLNTIEAGLRIRYEFKREFAPYVGMSWSKAFSDTADLIEANGDKTEQLSFVAGIRLWF